MLQPFLRNLALTSRMFTSPLLSTGRSYMHTEMDATPKPRFESISSTIQAGLSDVKHIEIVDESRSHSRGSESHFKLLIVSENFEGKRLLDRHRLLNQMLKDEYSKGVHSISYFLYSPAEWSETAKVPTSPACVGH